MKKFGLLGVLLFVFGLSVYAQSYVDQTIPFDTLVRKYLFGGGVEIDQVKYFGSRQGIGYFTSEGDFPISKGIVLSTGKVTDVARTNNNYATSTNLLAPGDYDIMKITPNDNFDAAVLEFDFKPEFDSFYFNFIFGSDEYDEFVGSRYNDVFAFLLNPHGTAETVNLAIVPGTKSIVCVNQINSKRNKELYVSNPHYDPQYNIEFDGFTQVMSAASRVKPGIWYHIKIVIADVNDENFDSGVILESGSFTSLSTEEVVSDKIKPGRFYQNIEYETDSFRIPNDFLSFFEDLFEFLNDNPDYSIKITGHTDNVGSEKYNQNLSEKRADEVEKYLVQKGIDPNRIEAVGLGSKRALASNETKDGRAKNRRIEFDIFIADE